MIVTKEYHFYAAHRNETLQDKCRNLHGHTYYVTMDFELGEPGDGGVTVLFGELDARVEPIVKRLDHALLLNITDPLCAVLPPFDMKTVTMDRETSCENLCKMLFYAVVDGTGYPLKRITIRETTTSSVTYEPRP